MNIGKFASCIRQARDIYVWVPYHKDDGVYVQVSKTSAKLILEDAREGNVIEILADMRADGLFIG